MQPRCSENCPQGWASSLIRKVTFSSAGAFGGAMEAACYGAFGAIRARDPEVALELLDIIDFGHK